MKTQSYNPSPLEIQFAETIAGLKDQIQQALEGASIVEVNRALKVDNPQLSFVIEDKDGDKHEVVIKIIQRIDDVV